MTLELDSKPTRTRRPKQSFEEQVAEADREPWPRSDIVTITDAVEADDIVGEPRECICTDSDNPNDHREDCPEWGRSHEDTGEIDMTPEAMAELRARASHMGLGGPNGHEPGTILVTGYANGEAVDVEVERSARAQEAAATGEPDPERVPQTKQIEMPGFEGHKATKVTVSFSGSITLDLGMERHKAMWDALRWQTHKSLTVTAFVNGKGFKAGKDNVAGASLTVMSAHLEDAAQDDDEFDEMAGSDADDCDAEGCENVGEQYTVDELWVCPEHYTAADDPEPFSMDPTPLAEPTALDAALALAGDDEAEE